MPVELPGVRPARYRAYPIVDHVADKVCALLEVHPRAAGLVRASTRYRVLVDLALIAHTQTIAAAGVQTALASEARRRGLELPATVPTPEGPGWRAGYARVARDVPGLAEQDLDDALATVRRFIEPVLGGTATGSRDPGRENWTG